MKHIPLTQGKFAVVDDEDYDWLMQWKWCARIVNGTYYAFRRPYCCETGISKRVLILMHREILGLCNGDGKHTDHINHHGWDNRKSNLRTCTIRENRLNSLPRKNTTSKYKGVSRHQGKWRAQICNHGETILLGEHVSETEAARIYDAKAKELFGEFAYRNFP